MGRLKPGAGKVGGSTRRYFHPLQEKQIGGFVDWCLLEAGPVERCNHIKEASLQLLGSKTYEAYLSPRFYSLNRAARLQDVRHPGTKLRHSRIR